MLKNPYRLKIYDSGFKNMRKQNERMKLGIKDLSYSFSLEIIDFVNSLPQDRILLPVGEQILRSSTSVGSNIVEAQASKSEKEFIKYTEIAVKSSHKSEYWLSLVSDTYKSLDKNASDLVKEVKDIRAMLEASLMRARA